MGKQFTLSASDSFKLGAYRADPAGTPKGGIVVIQEIFGVNQHIRKVCDDFAEEGYAAVAPALFDRTQKDFQSRLHAAGNREGAHLRRQARLGRDDARHRRGDQRAQVRRPGRHRRLLHGRHDRVPRATRLSGLSAAVGYYGGRIVAFADEKPKCPVQTALRREGRQHPDDRRRDHQAEARRHCEIYVYPDGGHGFHCDERGSFHKDSRDLAWQRTTAFLAKHMKK